jgi:predicted AAA+ superfamily ATPase
MNGCFFETVVIGEILKSYTNAGKEEDFYYLRDGNGREVDLLLFQDNTLFPIEIKQKFEPSSADIRHFAMLNEIKAVVIGEGGVICFAQDLLPLKEKHKIIPLWAL